MVPPWLPFPHPAHRTGRARLRHPALGQDRHAIAPAMREDEALGFVQVTERGRAGNADYRTPNKFRLTYQPTDSAGPTDDWRKIKTIEEAKAIAVAARKPIRSGRSTKGAAKSTKPVGINTSFSVGNPHRKASRPMGETPTTGKVGEAPPLSIFRVGARARRSSEGERASPQRRRCTDGSPEHMNRRRPNPHHNREKTHRVGSTYQHARWPAGAPAGSAVAGRPAHQFIVACVPTSRVTGIETAHGPLATPPEQMGLRRRSPLPPGGRRNFEINPKKKTVKTQLQNFQGAPRCGARTRTGTPLRAPSHKRPQALPLTRWP